MTRRRPARAALAVLMLLPLLLLASVAVAAPAAAGPWDDLDPLLPGVLTAAAGTVVRPALVDADRAVLRARAAAGAPAVVLRLAARPGERYFGLGERFGRFDLRGQVLANWTADGMGRPGVVTTYSPMPFLLSERGYAVHLDTAASTIVDLSGRDAVTITVASREVDVEVFTGPDPATVVRDHAVSIGLPPVPPPWGLGVWKCLVGGTARVRADTGALLAAGVPLDAVWTYDIADPASGFGWPWQVYGPVPPGPYPDPAALIAGLHADGLAVLGYLTPFVVVGAPGYAGAAARGYLVTTADGVVYTQPWLAGTRRAYVDFTDPAATAWWQDRVRAGLTGVGFDGAMQDYGEDAPAEDRYADGEPGALVHNAYPRLYADAVRAAAQSVKPDTTVFFARSGYTGAQSAQTGRFTGDQTRDWDIRTGLGSVLAGMLNGSLSGWPYWGPDIGGFLSGTGERDRDLWTRWVQLGALSPVMRDMLGAQTDPIGVQTDVRTLATFRGYALLHRALEPYLHELAVQAHGTGAPLMRPLWLDDPTERTAWSVSDEYTLGPAVLVAPVTTPSTRSRPVWLPSGTWRDYWTGATVTGPAWIRADAPVGHIPLWTGGPAAPDLPPPASLGLPGGLR
ncbi:MAG: glycoside hydrolase family 31 protein [Pseudonocardia sp.]|uniref:TIM-barrel domain-containing protein n=1 Tax=Pseudonocardia sp. TaxID=60912 RepID=UPI001AC55CCB|nr:TIM-barrel domain-containing protein [Pseudonocardia sp.]MBN9096929.1 glycoside hydrolase family 31 protein [Pseudonocardia sp.]